MTNIKGAMFAASFLLFALPAHAQRGVNAGGGASRSATPTFSGGGGAGGGGGSMGFGFLPATRPTSFRVVSAQGSSAYEPSSFVSYEKAVEMGNAALAYKPKSIVEVAAEYRANKKPKN